MKTAINIYLFIILSIIPLKAIDREQNYLRPFLEYIQEDSVCIDRIMNSPEAVEPMKTLEFYLIYNMKLEYDSTEQKMVWREGWNDSVFTYKCATYLTQKIVCDTALQLIEPYLLESYLINHQRSYARIFLECAEYSIAHFHSRNVILIPELYYFNHHEKEDWQKRLNYYKMIEFILHGTKYCQLFVNNNDNDSVQLINKLITKTNDAFPYFVQYRDIIDSKNDLELARISETQEREIVDILIKGMENGDRKAVLTYAFMLITGQFVSQDEMKGKSMLLDLLK